VTINTGTWRRPSGKSTWNVTEVGLGPERPPMIERDERLAAVESPVLQVAADRIVAAGVAVFGHQTPEDLLGRVALLPRGRLIGRHKGIDQRAERAEHRSRAAARPEPAAPARGSSAP